MSGSTSGNWVSSFPSDRVEVMAGKYPWLALAVFPIVCFAAAGIGGAVTNAEDRHLVRDLGEAKVESANPPEVSTSTVP